MLADCIPENHEYQIDLSQSIVLQIWTKKTYVTITSHLEKKGSWLKLIFIHMKVFRFFVRLTKLQSRIT